MFTIVETEILPSKTPKLSTSTSKTISSTAIPITASYFIENSTYVASTRAPSLLFDESTSIKNSISPDFSLTESGSSTIMFVPSTDSSISSSKKNEASIHSTKSSTKFISSSNDASISLTETFNPLTSSIITPIISKKTHLIASNYF